MDFKNTHSSFMAACQITPLQVPVDDSQGATFKKGPSIHDSLLRRSIPVQSPFPGMDPYLEEPRLWPDVHHGLISEMQALLNRRLRPHYHVRVEERVYISDENDPGRKAIIPDLKIVETGFPSGVDRLLQESSTAIVEPLILTTLIEDEIHEARLEVIDTQQNAVVTVIELLGPTNKIAGSRGRASYEQKRREVMTSPLISLKSTYCATVTICILVNYCPRASTLSMCPEKTVAQKATCGRSGCIRGCLWSRYH
jgi:hypothetical protein